MPTLVDITLPILSSLAGENDQTDDASETIIFHGDESTIYSRQSREGGGIDESTMFLSPVRKSPAKAKIDIMDKSTILLSPYTTNKNNEDKNNATQKSMLDNFYKEESTILSRSLLNEHPQNDNDEVNYSFEASGQGQQVHFDNQRRHYNQDSSSRCPNRDIYKEKYQDYVKGTIANFQNRQPGRLRDYTQMSSEEKVEAQKNLLDLLAKLGITRVTQGEESVSRMESQPARDPCMNHHQSPRNSQIDYPQDPAQVSGQDRKDHPQDPDETILSISPQATSRSTLQPSSRLSSYLNMKDTSPICPPHSLSKSHDEAYLEADKSALLLSPGDNLQQISDASNTSFGFQNNNYNEESVEIPRAEKSFSSHSNSYKSPDRFRRPNPQKRVASTSGKRGSDTVRQRIMSDDMTPPLEIIQRDSEIIISSHMSRLSISPSSGPRDLFEASQSPISPRLTYGTCHEDDEKPSGMYKGPSNPKQRHHLRSARDSEVTIDTVELTQRKLGSKDKRRGMRDIPINIKLAPGATFHLDKLSVKRTEVERPIRGNNKKGNSGKSRMRRWVNFPDPLVRYNRKQKQILNDIYEWIDESESNADVEDIDDTSRNVIFSLSPQQIIDVTLKVLSKDSSEQDKSINVSSKSKPNGGTIIVVRRKEDTAQWETALREGTCCSVLNHATLSLSERIRASTSEKARKYDVVLATFDSLKSPDVAIPVNEFGHAIFTKPTNNNGWYSNRSSDDSNTKQQCKQFSVLHRIDFKRIVFVDVLGRKSFLAKYGTARATAAIALRGSSR
jgi:hypothetical protein